MNLGTIARSIEQRVTGLHKAVFQATGGRVLGRTALMPVVMLTTTGRRSGQKRTTMLTAPIVEEGMVVLVASHGGAPRSPDWYHNLVANPDVEITMKGDTRTMMARVASKAEKDELWPRIVRRYVGYGAYQLRTSRDIPVVILEPRS